MRIELRWDQGKLKGTGNSGHFLRFSMIFEFLSGLEQGPKLEIWDEEDQMSWKIKWSITRYNNILIPN